MASDSKRVRRRQADDTQCWPTTSRLGPLSLCYQSDGDYIVFCDPDPGYVHGEEKMCEYRNVIQNIPHLERPVIHDSANITYSYSLAIEELVGVEAPRRGQFIRAIASELIAKSIRFIGLQSMAYFLVTPQCSCGQLATESS